MTSQTSDHEELRRHDLCAIAMGGSAGAVAALQQLLPRLPQELRVPVFLVLHLGPDAKQSWPLVFASSRLPVREAEDKELAEPGVVHVAPPNYHLLVDESGAMSLSVEEPVNLARPSIDVLFESAAWAYGARLLGILLTGANADGAAGLASVARSGGLCWVQSPDTATVATMPRAGLQAVPQARVLTVEQMGEAIGAWNR